MKITETTTQTRTLTNTHIGVAVAMAVVAGGLAFAALPAKSTKSTLKCGVNKAVSVQVLKCKKGQYSGVDYTCYDGSKQQYRPGKCVSSATVQAFAKKACANKCNVPPKKTPPPAQPPVADQPVPGYGYNNGAVGGDVLPLADLRIQDVSFDNQARRANILIVNNGTIASDPIQKSDPNGGWDKIGVGIYWKNQEGRNINGDFSNLPAIQPGTTTIISFEYPPHDLMRSLEVTLDETNNVIESNEQNNNGVYPMPNPLQPDLRIQDVSFNNNTRTVNITVQNSGNGVSGAIQKSDPNGGWDVIGVGIFWKDQDGRNINSDLSNLPALLPEATRVISFDYPPHDLMHSVQVNLDETNSVSESNEQNNTGVYPIR